MAKIHSDKAEGLTPKTIHLHLSLHSGNLAFINFFLYQILQAGGISSGITFDQAGRSEYCKPRCRHVHGGRTEACP